VLGDVEVTDAVDPDVRARSRRSEFVRALPVLLVIALGGGIGSVARYGLALMLPTVPGGVPWATFADDVLGCLLIGVLMVLITEVWSAHRLLRPFLGVGVLGGFTTFSTYAAEIRDLLERGSVLLAFGYLTGTLLCALLAVLVGVAFTRWATGSVPGSRKAA
jgi:fluoride exporter